MTDHGVTESAVEEAAPAWLESTGWQIAHGPDVAPDIPAAARTDCDNVRNYRKFPDVQPDTLGVMPNHIHQIIVIADTANPVGADLRVRPCIDGAYADRTAYADSGAHVGAPLRAIVEWFKTMTTNEYILDNPARWVFDRENPSATTPEPENAWRT